MLESAVRELVADPIHPARTSSAKPPLVCRMACNHSLEVGKVGAPFRKRDRITFELSLTCSFHEIAIAKREPAHLNLRHEIALRRTIRHVPQQSRARGSAIIQKLRVCIT